MKHVFLIMLLLAGTISASAQYKVGDQVKDFKLKNIDDKMVSLADYSDAKGFIVCFTCNHCPFSVAYEDRLIAIDKKYKQKGYPLIAINPNDEAAYPEDDFEHMKQRAKEKGFTFPYLRDLSQDVAKQFGAKKTPHMYIVQKEGGKLTVKYIGAVDNNSHNPEQVTEKYLEQALDELIAGKTISKNFTRAVGCSVKYK